MNETTTTQQSLRSQRQSKAFHSLDAFICSQSVKHVTQHYKAVNEWLDIDPNKLSFASRTSSSFDYFTCVRNRLLSSKQHNKWFRVSSTLNKLDKRSQRKQYFQTNNSQERCLRGSRVLVIGGGLSGLRVAIELCLLGACVLVVEKRTQFTRNNVIHLWPNVISDVHSLGGKRFYARFCSGAIDHVSIRSLQLVLLKVALLFGACFAPGIAFDELCPQVMSTLTTTAPPTQSCDESDNTCECCCHEHTLQSGVCGARAHFRATDGNASDIFRELFAGLSFDVVIGCDGRRNTLCRDFPRKEFRGRLAIAITANFVNHKTESEARVQEISGVSYIYAQQWFQQLFDETGIQLENVCYYRDETHYFVMTATKKSLLAKHVLVNDESDTTRLLHTDNISRAALLAFARQACEWTSGLRNLEFALNSNGSADVSLFDFTSVYAARNASRAKLTTDYCVTCTPQNHVSSERKYVLTMLCGDSLLEPFWPTGSGAGRGFLAALDCAWTTRQWVCALNATKSEHESKRRDALLDVIAERESVYRLLAQTTPENVSPNAAINESGLNPERRYRDYNSRAKHEIKRQISHLCPHVSSNADNNVNIMSTSLMDTTNERKNDTSIDDNERRATALAAKRQRRQTVAVTPSHVRHESSPNVVITAKRDWLLGNEQQLLSNNNTDRTQQRAQVFNSRVRDFEATQTTTTRVTDQDWNAPSRRNKSREIVSRAKDLEHVLESTAKQRFEPVLQRVAKLDVTRDWNFKIWTQNQIYVAPKPLVSAPTRAQQNSAIHESRVHSIEKKLNETSNEDTSVVTSHPITTRGTWIATLSEELQSRGVDTSPINQSSTTNTTTATVNASSSSEQQNSNTTTTTAMTTPAVTTTRCLVCVRCEQEVDSSLDRICVSGAVMHRSCLRCRVCGVSLRLAEVRDSVSDFLCVMCCARNPLNNTRLNHSYKHMSDVTRAKSAFLEKIESLDLRERIEFENKEVIDNEDDVIDGQNEDIDDDNGSLSDDMNDECSDDDSDSWSTTTNTSDDTTNNNSSCDDKQSRDIMSDTCDDQQQNNTCVDNNTSSSLHAIPSICVTSSVITNNETNNNNIIMTSSTTTTRGQHVNSEYDNSRWTRAQSTPREVMNSGSEVQHRYSGRFTDKLFRSRSQPSIYCLLNSRTKADNNALMSSSTTHVTSDAIPFADSDDTCAHISGTHAPIICLEDI